MQIKTDRSLPSYITYMHHGHDRARIVLLGASNVTKGVSVIIETARTMLGSPLDVYCAIGHGRSYGMKSFVLVRSLPSVLDSGLWRILAQSKQLVPTYALIADVGNDVMYGSSPEQIVNWVAECVQRLEALDARIVMTSLPTERIERLTPLQYLIARSLLFPSNRMTFEEARSRAQETAQRMAVLAAGRSLPLVELRSEWYGIDPIHIRGSHKAEAWRRVLSHWPKNDTQQSIAQPSLRRWLQLRTASPERWWLLGKRRGRSQPSVTLTDGSQVSLY